MKIKMLLIAAILLTNISCDNQETSTKTATPDLSPTDTPNVIISSSAKNFTAIQVVQATYENATVYAASTDYYFKNVDSGQEIKFRNSNLEEEATVKMPTNMLQESEDGPPEVNQALIGKVFMISTIEGKITEVELEENYDDDDF